MPPCTVGRVCASGVGTSAHLATLVEDLCDLEGYVLGVGSGGAEDNVDAGREIIE
jgi:galactitol-specific phosphotransferase system IIB component